jgi:hypothetical protein
LPWLDLLIEASPFLSERDGSRRAVEQADANVSGLYTVSGI